MIIRKCDSTLRLGLFKLGRIRYLSIAYPTPRILKKYSTIIVLVKTIAIEEFQIENTPNSIDLRAWRNIESPQERAAIMKSAWFSLIN
jgi:hypothetical protein